MLHMVARTCITLMMLIVIASVIVDDTDRDCVGDVIVMLIVIVLVM